MLAEPLVPLTIAVTLFTKAPPFGKSKANQSAITSPAAKALPCVLALTKGFTLKLK